MKICNPTIIEIEIEIIQKKMGKKTWNYFDPPTQKHFGSYLQEGRRGRLEETDENVQNEQFMVTNIRTERACVLLFVAFNSVEY